MILSQRPSCSEASGILHRDKAKHLNHGHEQPSYKQQVLEITVKNGIRGWCLNSYYITGVVNRATVAITGF